MQNFFGEERILVLFLVPVALFAPLGRRGLGARIEGPFVNPLFPSCFPLLPFVSLCLIPRARSSLRTSTKFQRGSAKLLIVDRDIEMSFIPVSPENHFPVKNLPYGVFSTFDNVSKLTYLRR